MPAFGIAGTLALAHRRGHLTPENAVCTAVVAIGLYGLTVPVLALWLFVTVGCGEPFVHRGC